MASIEEVPKPSPKPLSLVSSILKKDTDGDNIQVEESIQRVQKKCSDLKLEITEFLQQNYQEFSNQADNVVSLEHRIREATIDYERLLTLIDKDIKDRLSKSVGKKQEVEHKLAEIQTKITFLSSLLQIHRNIETARQELGRANHTRCAELITAVKDLVNVVGEMGCDASVFRALKSEIHVTESDLKYELLEQWNSHVIWNPVAITKNELNRSLTLDLTLTLPQQCPSFEGVVNALTRLLTEEQWRDRVKGYTLKVLERIIKPLLNLEGLRLDFKEEQNKVIVSFIEDKNNNEERKEEFVAKILNDIIQLFTVINNMMTAGESEGDDTIEWMEHIGETIEPELYIQVKDLLSHHSPKTPTQRDQYSIISTAVTHFEETLKTLGLLDVSYTSFTSYTSDVDIHVVTQHCQERLGHARTLLLSPIHDTVCVGGAKDTLDALGTLNLIPNKIDSLGNNIPTNQESISDINTPSQGSILNINTFSKEDLESLTFIFPSCLVSKCIKEFIDLLYSTLVESSKAGTSVAVVTQLNKIARDMIELFIAISRNSTRLTSVSIPPRNSLVLHNNYMYVAHHLITIGHQFTSRQTPGTFLTFIDYVPRLRSLGEEVFLAEMDRESNDILSFLEPVLSFEDIGSSSDKQETLSRGVKQSLLQVFKLSKIYTEALPEGLAKRCRSGLLEVLISELVLRTLAVEDFSVDDGTFLHNFITNDVLNKCPLALSLTKEEFQSSIVSVCPSWDKLSELAFVLNATQEDIVSRWNKGEGPLAKVMSASDVKHLMRATFKNTQRRADNLAKIV